MMSRKQLLLLNGSPRKKGTSYSFARTIKALAEDGGHTAEIVHIIEYFDGAKELENLRQMIAESQIIGLTSPLYVDALPYPVIKFFEMIASEYSQELRGKSFFAIGQCGFPDVTLLEPLLGSCQCFAAATGMQWLGGLGYGGGPMINGTNLEELGKKGGKITSAFKLLLEDVTHDRLITPQVQPALTNDVPKILYGPLAAYLNRNARKEARKLGRDLYHKPYLE